MARLIELPGGEGPVNEAERAAVRYLVEQLPSDYTVVPNFLLEERTGQHLEYDVVVVAPHGVYAVEVKGWRGIIEGDGYEWVVNGRSRRAPSILIERKAKILKSRLVDSHQAWARVRVEALVMLTEPMVDVNIAEGGAARVFDMVGAGKFITQPEAIRQQPASIIEFTSAIVRAITSAGRARRSEVCFGDFVVLEALEQSDEETVYRARHRDMPAAPAVRLRVVTLSPYLLSEQQRSIRKAQLFREAEALLTMGSHANIVAARSVFADDAGRIIVVLDDDEGRSLRQRLRNGTPLAVEERLDILIGVGRALRHAHAHGVIHRQVAPENVVLDGAGTARLARFGLAKLAAAGAATVWDEGSAYGSLAPYLAPELSNPDLGPPGPATDLFGFGCIAYELFAHRRPFDVGGSLPTAAEGRLEGMPDGLWELMPELLRQDPATRASDAAAVVEALEALTHKGRPASTGPKLEYRPGDLIDGKFEVKSRLGEGGFSSVYRVYRAIEDREFALKIFNTAGSLEKLQREVQLLRTVSHPHIVNVVWADQTQAKQWYLVTEYIDGQPLSEYTTGSKRLSPREAVDVVIDLLGALEAIHPDERRIAELKLLGSERALTGDEFGELQTLQDAGIVHRDVKPQNLMLTDRGVVLIDFNIASKVGDPVVTVSGTPPYQPPDAKYAQWTVSPDLFATGVVLYELLCGTHPYPDGQPRIDRFPKDPRQLRGELSDEIAEFLLRACAPLAEQRFQSAQEMRSSLQEIVALVHTTAPVNQMGLPLRLAGLVELRVPNVNPFVREFLSLASQARISNRNARGLNDLAEATYVETRLDEHLVDAILEGRHRLVVITGNAGDGKTAFIQQMELQALRRGAARVHGSANGGRFRYAARDLMTLYDGSQDEDETSSDDLLHSFFWPVVQGNGLGEVRVAAINEGRLRDFIVVHRERYPRLLDLIVQLDDPNHRPANQDLALVNLNWRSVTTGGADSIFSRQVQRIVGGPFWQDCQNCDYRARCPIKHNVDTLRDTTAGPVVTERLRRVVDLIRLRQRRHLTIRDIRSLISFILFRDRTCEEIGTAMQRDDPMVLVDLAYFQAIGAIGEPEGSVVDRSSKLLAEADVALVVSPLEDAGLAFGRLPRLMDVPTREGAHPRELLLQAQQQAGFGYESNAAGAGRVLQALRRLAFFERNDEKWWDMLPYRRLRKLEGALEEAGDQERNALLSETITALSMSEGVDSAERASTALWLATTDDLETGMRSYRRFALAEFAIEVSPAQRSYVEALPDHLEMVHVPTGVTLPVTIDVLEVLERLQEGHVPSLDEARGLLVNLRLFKHQLLAAPSATLVLVTQDGDYEIAAREGGLVELYEAKT